jgi:hypothetical protein
MSIVLQGSTSGSITLQEPAVAGTNTLTLPAATGTVATTADITSSFTGSNVSKTANGYQKLPSGVVMQWGTITGVGVNSTGTVTFPVAFPTACGSVTTTSKAGANSLQVLNVPSSTTTTFSYASYGSGDFMWFAIGY